MPTSTITIKRRFAEVGLKGDASTVEWVRYRGQPYFTYARQTGESWNVIAGLENASQTAKLRKAREHPYGTSRYWLSVDERTIVVDAEPGAWRRLWTLRIIRDLLRWQLSKKGALFLHGSVFIKDGEGLAILGRSKSGKTSLLLDALRDPTSSFVTEDDLTIIRESDGRFVALGWPGCVRLRPDMLWRFPEFMELEHLAHPENAFPAKATSAMDRIRIFPEEIATRFGCGILGEATISSLQWLEWGDEVTETEMSPAETQTALMSSWDILPERRPGTRPTFAKNIPPLWRNFCFNPFLVDLFGEPLLEPCLELLTALASSRPAFRAQHVDNCARRLIAELST